MATKLEGGGGAKNLLAGPLKKVLFFAASLINVIVLVVRQLLVTYFTFNNRSVFTQWVSPKNEKNHKKSGFFIRVLNLYCW